MSDDTEPRETAEERRKRILGARQSRRTTRARRTTTKPPNRVDPGWLHDLLAAMTLKVAQEKTDGKIRVGDVSDEFVRMIPGMDDAPEPAVLLSRIYAHLMYRVPLLRGAAKRLEGKEIRAGLGSDVLALLAQLYLRNRDVIAEARRIIAQRAAQDRAAKKTSPNGATDTATMGEVIS